MQEPIIELTGWTVILILKVAVAAVTVLLIASLVALALGKRRLHGQINLAFMVLTFAAVFGLEFLIRAYDPKMFDIFDLAARRMLNIHLCFSVPTTVLLPAMYFTGRTGRRRTHLVLAAIFGACWTGTFVTGIFYLPHAPP